MKRKNPYLFWFGLLIIGLLWSACGTVNPTSNHRGDGHNLGYMKISKENNTNSIGQWNRNYNADTPNLTVADMLMRVPGVQIRGHGSNVTVTVRGVNSFYGGTEPLFVVDGMSVGFGYSSVSFLNPMEIDNISVIKDSGAAIYGVRGANGVIIIETKGVDKEHNRKKR